MIMDLVTTSKVMMTFLDTLKRIPIFGLSKILLACVQTACEDF